MGEGRDPQADRREGGRRPPVPRPRNPGRGHEDLEDGKYFGDYDTGSDVVTENEDGFQPGLQSSALRDPLSVSSGKQAVGLSVPKADPESRHLVASTQFCASPGEHLLVRAKIVCAYAGSDPSVALAPIDIPDEGLDITITVSIDGHARLITDENVAVRVFRGKDSAEAAFLLMATHTANDVLGQETHLQVQVRAYARGAYLGQVALKILQVARDDNRTCRSLIRSAEGAMTPRTGNPRTAILEVAWDETASTYRFTLRGGPPELGHPQSFPHRIDAELARVRAEIISRLNKLAHGDPRYGIQPTLDSVGGDLWDRMLPAKLQGLLHANLANIDRLAILSEDDSLPWELLRTPRVNPSDSGVFLAEHWLIYRLFYGPQPSLAIGPGPTRYVLPTDGPRKARDEIDALLEVYPSTTFWSTQDEVLKGIDEGDIGLLHVAAHNTVNGVDGATSHIELDTRFEVANLSSKYFGALERKRPLVFINACSSAAAAPQWVGATSWASRFNRAGAGAFVGSLWKVRDDSARVFALEFYRATKGGASLGEAFQSARSAIPADDPTRYAYALFGEPDAKLIPAISHV